MMVKEMRGNAENYDIGFPVGLRILAVDDDMICLKLLETMLRKCQYHVTTSSQSRMALKMLRENKDGFDLVISDVHMPDMDGFKLLELVGLEMDIPVIMLSANSDPKLVLKGVTHGACDYLVKPVRLEELQNVWQHVIRKKKLQLQDVQNGEVYESPPVSDTSDQKPKLNRKRKDDDDSGNDDDDLVTQKKPRVVWSPDLHQKFIAAVNQLGLEKAVPKKILDLMNTEGLTRENVASHLQKFRIYLRKLNTPDTQHGNVRATGGLDDYRYMRNYSSDLVGDYRTFSGIGRLPNASLPPYTRSGTLGGRLNSSASFNLRNLTQPSLTTPTLSQNLSNPLTTLGKTNPSPKSTTNLFYFQGNPSSVVFNNFQKSVDNFDMTANKVNTFNSEPYNVDVNGFASLPDSSQLHVDNERETNASNGFVLPSENSNEWQGGFDSFEDLMNTVLKRDQDGTLPNCDFGIDEYAFGVV